MARSARETRDETAVGGIPSGMVDVGQAVRAVLQPLAMAEHEVDEAVAALLEEAELIGSASDVHDAVGFLLPPVHGVTWLRSVCGALFEALVARRVASGQPAAYARSRSCSVVSERKPRARPSERKPSARQCLGGPGGFGFGLRGCWWQMQLQPGGPGHAAQRIIARRRSKPPPAADAAATARGCCTAAAAAAAAAAEIPEVAEIDIPDECDLPEWSRTYLGYGERFAQAFVLPLGGGRALHLKQAPQVRGEGEGQGQGQGQG